MRGQCDAVGDNGGHLPGGEDVSVFELSKFMK